MQGNNSAVIALTTLRRAGIPVPGLGVAAAPKRVGRPVRLSGANLGRIVMRNFFGQMIPYAGAEDIMGQQASDWQYRRGNDTGYACPDLQRDPGTAAAALQALAADHCGLAPEACSGVDVPGVASQLAQAYAAWFGSAFPKGWGDCYNYDAATFAAKFPGANRADYWQGGSPGGYVPDTYPGASSTGGGNTTGYTVPNTVTNTYGTQPANTPPPTGGGGNTSTPPQSTTGNGPSGPVVVTLRNISRPNMPLAVGDRFELNITGSPYSPVSIDATRDGSQRGVSSFGNTDGQGLKIIPGQMTANEVGHWVEVVTVANSTATLSFSVGQAPGMAPGGGPAAAGSGSNTGGGGSTAVPGATGGPDYLPALPSSLPSWALPAAIAAVAVFMLRK